MTTQPERITDEADLLIPALLEISNLVGSSKQLDRILNRIVQVTADLMQLPICSIYLIEPDGALRKRSNVGLDQELSKQATFPQGQGIPGWVAEHGELVALADVTQDPRYGPLPVSLKEPHAYICAPLTVDDEIIGVLTARKMKVAAFTPNQCRVFETAGKMIAIVIDKHRTEEEKIEALHLASVATSLSEIAHYVKNIMFTTQVAEATISSAIERIPDLERVATSWRNLKRSNQRIRKLVGDMLNFCRSREPAFASCDLSAMIRETATDLEDHAAKHNTRIETDLDPSLSSVQLDSSSVYDVLLNLITNGIDAIPDGRDGCVEITTKRCEAGDAYTIVVSDNGTGIPPDVRERIFSLFFSTKGKQGTGIGLAATRKAIEKHGGTISVETSEGQGARFIVYLPLSPSRSAIS